MFSDHDETSPSIAAVSAPSVACSMLAVQQRKRLMNNQFGNYYTTIWLSEKIHPHQYSNHVKV